MNNLRVNTLEHISLADFTNIWNRCWQGYYFNMTYSPEHMRLWLQLSQVSLRHSLAILVKDRIAGFTVMSIEGSDGWIAGACIDPEYRRRGLFTPLVRSQLKLATHLGLQRVYLEVIEGNHAFRVYQKVGFTQTRRLFIYRVHDGIDSSHRFEERRHLEPISVESYFNNRQHAFFNPAWQRREGYLRRYKCSSTLINSAGTAGALLAGENNALCLDAWSATKAGAEEVISNVLERASASFALTNQPEDWITTCLSAQGIYPSAKQFEMCITLT